QQATQRISRRRLKVEDPTQQQQPPPRSPNSLSSDSQSSTNSSTTMAALYLDLTPGSKDWLTALLECPDFSRQTRELTAENSPATIEVKGNNRTDIYNMNNNRLSVRVLGFWRICVPSHTPNVFRMQILRQAHDSMTAGHFGEKKTMEKICYTFYWPQMTQDVENYVATCKRCRMSKHICMKSAGLLHPLDIPNRRWGSISMDFIVGLPATANNNNAILSVVDRLSKMAHFIPCSISITAKQTAQLFLERVVAYHGIPDDIVSDRDARFTSAYWEEFCDQLNIIIKKSTSFHPQTDGQTERANRTIEQMLRLYIETDEKRWEEILPVVELAYNCAKNESTGMSPFEVMIGENPKHGTIEEDCITWEIPLMDKRYKMIVHRVTTQLHIAQQRQKKQADRHRRELELKVGDLVYVSTRNMYLPYNRKFRPLYVGPYPVVQKVGKVAYKLQLPRDMLYHPVFHVSLLVPTVDVSPNIQRQEEEWQPIIGQHGDPEWEVEEIMDVRGKGRNTEYLVRWKCDAAPMWLNKSLLDNCKEKIAIFNRNTRSGHLRGP
ncbi:MAG: hypothetical protein ACRC28_03545, partial [Clostridium sp.]